MIYSNSKSGISFPESSWCSFIAKLSKRPCTSKVQRLRKKETFVKGGGGWFGNCEFPLEGGGTLIKKNVDTPSKTLVH